MTCPGNPPAPSGYQIWRGSVPTPLTQWAMDLRDKVRGYPYGQTWTLAYGGQVVVARKDYHTWTYQNGGLRTGICIPGITLYSPTPPTTGTGMLAHTLGDTPDTVQPDPSLGVYGAPETTDWKLVGASAVAIVAVGALFALAIRNAGRVAR